MTPHLGLDIFPTAETKVPEIRRLRPRGRHQQRLQRAPRIPRAPQREERPLREALRKVLDRSEIHRVCHDVQNLQTQKWDMTGYIRQAN